MSESSAPTDETAVLEPEPELSEEELSIGVVEPSDDDLTSLQTDEKMEPPGVEVSPGYNAARRGATQIGTRETPINCQPYSRWFNVACAEWCAYFISWCFDTSEAGNRNKVVPWGSPGACRAIYNWASGRSLLVTTPQTGDIMMLTNFGHCGIVRGVNTSTGVIMNVEGNYRDAVSTVYRNYRITRFYFARVRSMPA